MVHRAGPWQAGIIRPVASFLCLFVLDSTLYAANIHLVSRFRTWKVDAHKQTIDNEKKLPISHIMNTPVARKSDPAKLVSLLALATGAVAMPQSASADIIYTDLTSSPVTVGANGVNSFSLSFPGQVQFGFQVKRRSTGFTYYRSVVVGKLGGAVAASVQGVGGFALQRGKGASWNNAYLLYNKPAIAKATSDLAFTNHNPGSYTTHEYLSFSFRDTAQGNAQLYGWAEISLSNSTSTDPNVTLYGYAYDTTGAQIVTGAGEVPEPSSAALLALGALTFGAKGLRSWRRNRVVPGKS